MYQAVRRHTALDGGEKDEGLEGRTRLPLGLNDVIILVVGIVASADHGLDGAVAVDDHGRGFARVVFIPLLVHAVFDDALRDALQLIVDGRFDDHVLVDVETELGSCCTTQSIT